jgi:hypothetical protein
MNISRAVLRVLIFAAVVLSGVEALQAALRHVWLN